MFKLFSLQILFIFLMACQSQQPPKTASLPQAPSPYRHFLVKEETVLRVGPAMTTHVPHPHGIADVYVNNYVGTLLRGKKVTADGYASGFYKVTVEDGAIGYIDSNSLIASEDLQEAALLEDSIAYKDLEKQQIVGHLSTGELLFIKQHGAEISLVQSEHFDTVWLTSEVISSEPRDIGVSRLMVQAKYNEEHHLKAINQQLLDKARLKYKGSPLIDKIAEEVDFLHFKETPLMPTHELLTNQ